MITVHHYDHTTGQYLGTQDIPQRPPGVGLPAGCTEVPPPADVPEGQLARWTGECWTVEPIPAPPPPLYGYDASGICTGPLLPGQPLARSTDVPPPDPEPGTVAVWDGQEWSFEEDHRGQTVYETATGFPRVLAAVGPIPEDCTEMAWPGVGHVWDGAAWTLTLEAAKAAVSAAITTRANSIMATLAVEYGEFERQTWDQQAIEARAILADPEADAPLVRAIATTRGQDAQELAARILSNEATWKLASGAIVGHRLKLQDQLDACTDVAAVEALDIDTGWPGVS